MKHKHSSDITVIEEVFAIPQTCAFGREKTEKGGNPLSTQAVATTSHFKFNIS